MNENDIVAMQYRINISQSTGKGTKRMGSDPSPLSGNLSIIAMMVKDTTKTVIACMNQVNHIIHSFTPCNMINACIENKQSIIIIKIRINLSKSKE